MGHRVFKTTTTVMHLLEKGIRTHIHVEGAENIPAGPTLFVSNHFMRMETFILPYVLQDRAGMEVHSLADHSLFHGLLGDYLASLGTISINEPNRDRIIIGDLLSGRTNWVIYPEGGMIKDKHILQRRGRFLLETPIRKGPPHTGAAVLALKAEIIRTDLLRAFERGDDALISSLGEPYGVSEAGQLARNSVRIVPVNLTYYPLRAGANPVAQTVKLLFKELPSRVEEELQVEGRLLCADSDMTIYFDAPIDLAALVAPLYDACLKRWRPPDRQQRQRRIVQRHRVRLTHRFMTEIYTKVAINMDHLVCATLRACKRATVSEIDFRRAVYLSALQIRGMRGRRIHSSLRDESIWIVTGLPFEPFENILEQAREEGALQRADGTLRINRAVRNGMPDVPFHDRRLKNITAVLANEVQPMGDVVRVIRKNVNSSTRTLRARLADEIHRKNVAEYEYDYDASYEEGVNNAREVGRPFYLKARHAGIGVVLAHGYCAAPEEVRPLAEHLHAHHCSVYGVRLKGMGTAPPDLAGVAWEAWLHSYERGLAVIRNTCEKVFVAGFSAGGLLALLCAARQPHAFAGVICMNTPLLLQDTRAKLIPTVLAWNRLADRLNLPGGEYEYVDVTPENPHINYSRNYLRGVVQLDRLIAECSRHLAEVIAPILIVQGTNDPTVNPKSAELIENGVSSDSRRLELFDRDRHGIIYHEGREEIFERVADFVRDFGR